MMRGQNKTLMLLLLLVIFAQECQALQRSNAAASPSERRPENSNARPSNTKQRKAESWPTSPTLRGGYSSRPPVRHRIRNLFSSASSAVTAPPPARWDRSRPPNNNMEGDYSGWMGDNHGDNAFWQQTSRHPLPTYVETLKRQVQAAQVEEELASRLPSFSAAKEQQEGLSRLDLALFGTYFSNMITITLPVVLMPSVAAEHVQGTGLSAATVVATIASVSTLGGGLGKVLNGFVCQFMGGSRASSLYLVGLAAASFCLSVAPTAHAGTILALMEFFASIQWTACSLVLANHYNEPAKLAKGITILSLASTSGQIAAKMGGTALLKCLPDWRSVAQLAGVTALVGAAIVKTLVPEHPVTSRRRQMLMTRNNQQQQQSIGQSLKSVLGSPLFWQVGIAHATAMLARTSDRILGTFFHQTTALPRSVCGGLTAFVTMGFVHGLIKGRKFHQLEDTQSKTKMLSKAYTLLALTAVAMAICSNAWIQALFFPSKTILAGTVAVLTGILASNISFQFYQIPAMVASTFGRNKALCLSLFDSLGFFLAAPVWAATGKIVQHGGTHGWSLAWLMLAAMFGAGGKTMMKAIPSVLQQQQQQQQQQRRSAARS